MRRLFGLFLVLAALQILVSGCGGSDQPAERKPEEGEPEPNILPWPEGTKTTGGVQLIKLEGASQFNVAELLTHPREELAAQADDCAARIDYFEQLHQQGRLPFMLLPEVRLPYAVPVFRQAKFSAKAGFSLPPYASEDRKDTELALHLARYGDVEAARKLVDPTDTEALKRIEALRLEHNYPVEWTRLVGMLLHRTQYHVLTGNLDEVKQLIGLHEQLGKLLVGKSRSSPLGIDLLARGRSILAQAAAAWRLEKRLDLADQADAFVRAWGELPAQTLPWQPPLDRARAERLFGVKSEGRLVSATAPLRMLDLLELAFPDDGLLSAIGTFDGSDRLEEILLLYRTREDEFYPGPDALTYVVLEAMKLGGAGTAAPAARTGGQWQTYALPGAAFDVALVRHNPAAGAIVRLRSTVGRPISGNAKGTLPRDFGGVSLDRSFEQNRRRVAWQQRANRITVTARPGLDQVQAPVNSLPVSRLALERPAGHDVLSRLTFHYEMRRKNGFSLGMFAAPLWALGGTAHIEGGLGPTPLLLAWEDDQTTYVLRLPNHSDQEATLDIYTHDPVAGRLDTPGFKWVDHPDLNFASRAAVVAAREHDARRIRFESGHPWMRLSRELEQIKLGMSREEVRQVLPADFMAFKRTSGNDLLVTMTGDLPRKTLVVPREYYVRFNGSGRVAEIGVRYTNGAGPGGVAKYLATTEKRAGAPELVPGPWLQTWADLPARKAPPTMRRWQDDTTRLTAQQDGPNLEVRLLDCPRDHEEGVPLPPLAYLQRGTESCALGTRREVLVREWKVGSPVLFNGAVVLAPKAGSPFDALLVWLDNDRVVKVVARHKAKSHLDAAQAGRAVVEAWTQESRNLGYPWRQDLSEEGGVQAWTTQDDMTRVRIFWQQGNDGSRRLFTEWRDLAHP
jgi:hypothetical protein